MPELKPGWLDRQMKEVRDDVATWPEWMRRAGGFMDERRSELTPEQREAALKLAERFSDSPEWSGELARALLDLHAENVRLREALKTGRDDLNHALKYDGGCDREETADVRDALSRALSGSPATEAVTSQRIHDLERELK